MAHQRRQSPPSNLASIVGYQDAQDVNLHQAYVFGSSQPRDFSYLDFLPPKFRVYNTRLRSMREKGEPTLSDYLKQIRNEAAVNSPDRRIRDRSVDSASRHFNYVFGSSTPRDLSYLDNLPFEFRIYDVKLNNFSKRADKRSKTTSFSSTGSGNQARRSSSLNHLDQSPSPNARSRSSKAEQSRRSRSVKSTGRQPHQQQQPSRDRSRPKTVASTSASSNNNRSAAANKKTTTTTSTTSRAQSNSSGQAAASPPKPIAIRRPKPPTEPAPNHKNNNNNGKSINIDQKKSITRPIQVQCPPPRSISPGTSSALPSHHELTTFDAASPCSDEFFVVPNMMSRSTIEDKSSIEHDHHGQLSTSNTILRSAEDVRHVMQRMAEEEELVGDESVNRVRFEEDTPEDVESSDRRVENDKGKNGDRTSSMDNGSMRHGLSIVDEESVDHSTVGDRRISGSPKVIEEGDQSTENASRFDQYESFGHESITQHRTHDQPINLDHEVESSHAISQEPDRIVSQHPHHPIIDERSSSDHHEQYRSISYQMAENPMDVDQEERHQPAIDREADLTIPVGHQIPEEEPTDRMEHVSQQYGHQLDAHMDQPIIHHREEQPSDHDFHHVHQSHGEHREAISDQSINREPSIDSLDALPAMDRPVHRQDIDDEDHEDRFTRRSHELLTGGIEGRDHGLEARRDQDGEMFNTEMRGFEQSLRDRADQEEVHRTGHDVSADHAVDEELRMDRSIGDPEFHRTIHDHQASDELTAAHPDGIRSPGDTIGSYESRDHQYQMHQSMIKESEENDQIMDRQLVDEERPIEGHPEADQETNNESEMERSLFSHREIGHSAIDQSEFNPFGASHHEIDRSAADHSGGLQQEEHDHSEMNQSLVNQDTDRAASDQSDFNQSEYQRSIHEHHTHNHSIPDRTPFDQSGLDHQSIIDQSDPHDHEEISKRILHSAYEEVLSSPRLSHGSTSPSSADQRPIDHAADYRSVANYNDVQHRPSDYDQGDQGHEQRPFHPVEEHHQIASDQDRDQNPIDQDHHRDHYTNDFDLADHFGSDQPMGNDHSASIDRFGGSDQPEIEHQPIHQYGHDSNHDHHEINDPDRHVSNGDIAPADHPVSDYSHDRQAIIDPIEQPDHRLEPSFLDPDHQQSPVDISSQLDLSPDHDPTHTPPPTIVVHESRPQIIPDDIFDQYSPQSPHDVDNRSSQSAIDRSSIDHDVNRNPIDSIEDELQCKMVQSVGHRSSDHDHIDSTPDRYDSKSDQYDQIIDHNDHNDRVTQSGGHKLLNSLAYESTGLDD